MKTNRIVGSILGLALGDAFGAPYEGGVLERAAWAVIGTARGVEALPEEKLELLEQCERLRELAERLANTPRR